MYKILKNQLDQHLSKEDMAHKNIEDKIDLFDKKIDLLKDNHIHHLALDLERIRSDMKWVLIIGSFIITTCIGILIAVILK